MSKMSIQDAAEHFGVSKEAIHNRIRRGSLEVVMEDGIKMVIVDATQTKAKTPRRTATTTSRTSSVSSERYYKHLEEQNAKLQARVQTLEDETRTLRDQKELMLIEERKKIEEIYKEKDEQLKNILTTISAQFMLSSPEADSITDSIVVETIDAVDVELEEEDKALDVKIVSLKKYVKRLDISEKKAQKIIKRFEKNAETEERIIVVNGKIYLDTVRYDYSDLIKK